MIEELDKATLEQWMHRLFDRLDQTDEKIKRLALQIAVEEIKVLDNQDMCLLLHVNRRTLQRYRKEKILKYFNVRGKNYYRVVRYSGARSASNSSLKRSKRCSLTYKK